MVSRWRQNGGIIGPANSYSSTSIDSGAWGPEAEYFLKSVPEPPPVGSAIFETTGSA